MNPIDTHENVADLFTKPLGADKFYYFTQKAVGDYVKDTHEYLFRDIANHKQRGQKNGGSVQTYRRAEPIESSSLMMAMAHAHALSLESERGEFEHAQPTERGNTRPSSFHEFSAELSECSD